MSVLGLPSFTAWSISFSWFVTASHKSLLKFNANYPFLLSILIPMCVLYSLRQAYARTVLCVSWVLVIITLTHTEVITIEIILAYALTPNYYFPMQIFMLLHICWCWVRFCWINTVIVEKYVLKGREAWLLRGVLENKRRLLFRLDPHSNAAGLHLPAIPVTTKNRSEDHVAVEYSFFQIGRSIVPQRKVFNLCRVRFLHSQSNPIKNLSI